MITGPTASPLPPPTRRARPSWAPAGIGIAMAANKVAGVRAATVHDMSTAELSRQHNDANVLCLGARVIDPGHAIEVAEYWLTVPFGDGRHSGRVAKINALDDVRAGP